MRKETNSLAPKSCYQKGHGHKITDWEKFREFARINRNLTSAKMTIEWEKLTNVQISDTVIQRALKKIGYTSKKTFGYIEANAEKRKQFLEELQNIDPALIVYSDETGIDDNEVPRIGWAPRGKRCYVKHVLVPALRPGMVVVIDNARFHKSKTVVDLIEAAVCKLMFLPPYSPDFNPIEHWWASVKNAIRSAAEGALDFYEAAINKLGEMCHA